MLPLGVNDDDTNLAREKTVVKLCNKRKRKTIRRRVMEFEYEQCRLLAGLRYYRSKRTGQSAARACSITYARF
jgi:hypothetical protein